MTEVNVDLKAKDQMSSVLDHVTQRLGVFSKAGLGMGIAFAGINIAVQGVQQAVGSVIQFIGDGINQFRAFEVEMQKVQNALKGLDKTMGGDIKKTIENFAVSFGLSVHDLAAGETTILKKGFDAADSLKILQSASVLAVATFSDLSETVDAVASSLEAFNMRGKDSAYVAAILADISQRTSIGMEEISNVMERIAPVMQEAGVSIEEFAAIVGKLGEKGMPARMVMSQLMSIIQNLEKPSEEQQKIMGEMGFSYDDLTLKVYGLSGMLGILTDRTIGNADAFRTLVGGMQEANAATFIVQAGLGKSEDIYKDYFSELEQMYNDATTKTQEFEEKKRKARQEAIGIKTGETFGAGVQDFIGVAQGAINQLGALTGGLEGYLNYYKELANAIDTANQTYDDLKVDAFISGMNQIDTEIQSQRDNLDLLTERINQYKKERDDLQGQKDTLMATHQYTEALRYIPMALEDASYMSKIFDERTRALVDSIRIQRAELKKLSDANEDLSFASQKASLEMLKIQQAAASNRGRMTREEKDRLKDLEATQLDLRIKEMENDLAATKIKREGLSQEEEELEKIKMAYGEKVYVIQDSYNKEVAALQTSIDAKNALILSHETAVDQVYTNIQLLIQGKLDAIDVYTKDWSEKMIAYYQSVTGESLNATRAQAKGQELKANVEQAVKSGGNQFDVIDAIKDTVLGRDRTPKAPEIPKWKYQQGGLVQETAPALVHKGEFVIPKELVDTFLKNPREMPHMQLPDMREPSMPVIRNQMQPVESGSCNKNVNITIHADLHKDTDVEEWGRKLGAGLASGFLDNTSSGTTTATSRKTGATIVVPGTSITTALGLRTNRAGTGVVTIPVSQPIKNKGRFRVG